MSIKRNDPKFNESMHFDRLLNGLRKGEGHVINSETLILIKIQFLVTVS